MQIKVVQGKGNKDRFTILPKFILDDLRDYYRQNRPKEFLFEGYIPDRPMHERAIGHMVTQCKKIAGFQGKRFSAHSLRHSFATHLLDQGTDIHTIKELLGHATHGNHQPYYNHRIMQVLHTAEDPQTKDRSP